MAKKNRYSRICRYTVLARLAQPMHVGDSLGDNCDVLVHPELHRPFIQAASLAGAMRDYSAAVFDEEEVCSLFGARRTEEGENAAENGSRIVLSDGLFPAEGFSIELRPHVAIDPKTGAAKTKAKFNMEYVGTGSAFVFEITARSSEAESEKTEKMIEEVLAALAGGQILLGGKKSSGCGRTELLSVMKKTYDMTKEDERKEWAKSTDIYSIEMEEKTDDLRKNFQMQLGREGCRDVREQLSDKEGCRIRYTVTLTGSPEGEMLIRSLRPPLAGEEGGENKEERASDKDRTPDKDSIRNAQSEYILPGSSIRGVLRHRTEAIATYLEEKGRLSSAETLTESMFGRAAKGKEPAVSGNVFTKDALIKGARSIEQKRIHIDKFTGGVMYNKLFTERAVTGDELTIEVDILAGEDADAAAALVLLVLRDAAVRAVGFGSGYSIGRGYVDAAVLKIQDRNSGETYSADLNGDTEDTLSEFAKGLLGRIS